MKVAGNESPLRRALLLALALAAVLAAIYSLRTRARSEKPRGAPRASSAEPSVEVDLVIPQPSASSLALAEPVRVEKTVRDRAQRDDARERIYRAFGRAPPGHAPSTGTRSAPLGDNAPSLDAAYIQKRVRKDFVPLAKDCYEAALERDPTLGGKLVFSFVIVGDEDVGGIVESAEVDPTSSLSEKELVYCMRESLLSLAFEPPKNGGTVTVTYPFVLSSKGPDGG